MQVSSESVGNLGLYLLAFGARNSPTPGLYLFAVLETGGGKVVFKCRSTLWIRNIHSHSLLKFFFVSTQALCVKSEGLG